jgi:hypothetical protein
MTMMVRETTPLGPCELLGEFVSETTRRFTYRRRPGMPVCYVLKTSPRIHIEPCPRCGDKDRTK